MSQMIHSDIDRNLLSVQNRPGCQHTDVTSPFSRHTPWHLSGMWGSEKRRNKKSARGGEVLGNLTAESYQACGPTGKGGDGNTTNNGRRRADIPREPPNKAFGWGTGSTCQGSQIMLKWATTHGEHQEAWPVAHICLSTQVRIHTLGKHWPDPQLDKEALAVWLRI